MIQGIRQTGIALLVPVGLMAQASFADAERVSLSPQWVPGHTTYVEYTWESSVVTTGTHETEKAARQVWGHTQGVLHKVVARLPEGGARIRLTFDRLALSLDSLGERRSFDSDDRSQSNASESFRRMLLPLLGASLTMELNGAGRVIDLTGVNDLARKLQVQQAEEDAYLFLLGHLEEEVQRNLWQQFYACYAFKEVQPGDTWTRTVNAGNTGRHEFTYRLDRMADEPGRRIAVVAYSSRQPTAPEPWCSSPGTEHAYEPSQLQGTAIFDIERGEFVHGQEAAKEVLHSKGKNANGEGAWQRTMTVSATQELVVLTESDRRQQRPEEKRVERPATE